MDTPDPIFKRVIVYIDGFNLYFGMRDAGWNQFFWLDVYKMAENILPPQTKLVGVNYFTSRISRPPGKQKRQVNYIEAVETTPAEIIFGKYQNEPFYCEFCDQEITLSKEKMTDVNIAVHMVVDAFQSNFDIALLVSGDSDLAPPVSEILRLFPEKKIIIAFPPKRKSYELESVATNNFILTRNNLKDSQFPESVVKKDGFILRRPDSWN